MGVVINVGRPFQEMEAMMLVLLLELTPCKNPVCCCFFRLRQGLAAFSSACFGQL